MWVGQIASSWNLEVPSEWGGRRQTLVLRFLAAWGMAAPCPESVTAGGGTFGESDVGGLTYLEGIPQRCPQGSGVSLGFGRRQG